MTVDSVQFIGVKPKALADRADVDFHLSVLGCRFGIHFGDFLASEGCVERRQHQQG